MPNPQTDLCGRINHFLFAGDQTVDGEVIFRVFVALNVREQWCGLAKVCRQQGDRAC